MDRKLKIAVQLYGHLRTYKECYPTLKKNLLDNYDCDVFMHTWDTLDHTTKAWHNLNEGKELIDLHDGIENEIIDLYGLKSVKVEKQVVKDMGAIVRNGIESAIFGKSSIVYGQKSVNLQREKFERENNIEYDFVLYTRPDIYFHSPFVIENFINLYTNDDLNEIIFITANDKQPDGPILSDMRYMGGKDLLYFGRPDAISTLQTTGEKALEDIIVANKNSDFTHIIDHCFYSMLEYSGKKILFCNYKRKKDFIIKRFHKERQNTDNKGSWFGRRIKRLKRKIRKILK